MEALNHDHVWGLSPAHEKQTGLFHARREGSRDRAGKATEASSAWLSSASRQSSLTGWILQKLELFVRLFGKTQLFNGLCLKGKIQVTAPRARSIFPRITGALKDLVAKPDRRDERLVLTNSNLMGRERFSERQAALLNAAARLAEAATLPETDIVRDAAIQRFEFTFELVWKTLQLYLEHEGLESSGPRAVLKRAFVMRLISDQDEADVWLRMLDDRNLTSHAYDETLAVRIYTRIVHDYAPRLAQMAKKIQTLRWE